VPIVVNAPGRVRRNTSLLAKRLRRIDAQHASWRHVAGGHCDEPQAGGTGRQRERIRPRDPDQHAANEPARGIAVTTALVRG
jgi:hypothetical protein